MNLQELEAQGFRLDIEGENLAVYAPNFLMTEDHINPLREHKQELMSQIVLRKFCQLVKHYAADRGVLLSSTVITRQLDSADIACLLRIPVWEKQQWAELLADRLTRGWPIADRTPDDAALH